MRARALRPVSALMRLDLPTLERPANAISGRSGDGIAPSSAAPATNSHGPANRRLTLASAVSLTRKRIRARASIASEPLEQAAHLHAFEEIYFDALPPHHHILLRHRQKVVPRPIDDEARWQAGEHECEDEWHEGEHALLYGIGSRRIELCLEPLREPHQDRPYADTEKKQRAGQQRARVVRHQAE